MNLEKKHELKNVTYRNPDKYSHYSPLDQQVQSARITTLQ